MNIYKHKGFIKGYFHTKIKKGDSFILAIYYNSTDNVICPLFLRN